MIEHKTIVVVTCDHCGVKLQVGGNNLPTAAEVQFIAEMHGWSLAAAKDSTEAYCRLCKILKEKGAI